MKHIAWQIDKSPYQSKYRVVIRMGPASSDDEWGTITVNGARAQERAAMLIRAVNAHEALVDALDLALVTIKRIKPSRPFDSTQGTRDVINAALKLAKGEE